jgi:hypothetical protein
MDRVELKDMAGRNLLQGRSLYFTCDSGMVGTWSGGESSVKTS